MMCWTAIVKSGKGVWEKTETIQFSGPHSFRATYEKLNGLGYTTVALVKGTHPVALEGGEESLPRMIGHI